MQGACFFSFFLASVVIDDRLLLLHGVGQCSLELDIDYLAHFPDVLPELISPALMPYASTTSSSLGPVDSILP